ncbi:MAG: phage tail protein [Desulfurococcaceae archaeon]
MSRVLSSVVLLELVVVSLLVSILPLVEVEAVIAPPLPPTMRIYYYNGTYADVIRVRPGENVSIRIIAVFTHPYEGIWLWLSNTSDRAIDPYDAYYVGPFEVEDVMGSEVIHYTFTPDELPEPFRREVRTYRFTVGRGWINGTLPVFVMGGVEYWIKLTDVNPTNGTEIAPEHILVSENKIVFYDTEICSAEDSGATLAPSTPVIISCVYTVEGMQYNITQVVNGEVKDWRLATIEVHEVHTDYGTTWVYSGFTETITIHDLGLRRTLTGPTNYTVYINVIRVDGEEAVVASFNYTVPAREVYLSGPGVQRNLYYHGEDYRDVVRLIIGRNYTVEVNWFTSSGTISVYLNETLLVTQLLNETGGAEVDIEIPADVTPGVYVFRVLNTGEVEYNFTVDVVLIIPMIEVVPSRGYVGDTVTVYGYNFDEYIDRTVTIVFARDIHLHVYYDIGNCTITAATWSCDIVIPTIPGGNYTVLVRDETTGEYISVEIYDYLVNTTFTVLPRLVVEPSVIPSSYDGFINITGTGFEATTLYWVTLDNQFLALVKSDENGTFRIQLVGGGFRPGLHVIAVYKTAVESGVVYVLTDTVVAYAHFTVTEEGDIIAGKIDELKEVLVLLINSSREEILIRIDNNTVTILSELREIKTDLATLLELLEGINATLIEIKGDIATISTNVGYIRVKVDFLERLINLSREAIIEEIRDGVAVIQLNIGNLRVEIRAKLDAINATLIEIKGDIATISTNVGEIKARVDTLRDLIESSRIAIITEIRDGVATIQTDLAEIKAVLDALEPVIIDINDTVVTILTRIGELQADLSMIRDLIDNSTSAIITEIRGGIAVIQTNISSISAKLDAINATLVEVIGEGIGRLETAIGDLLVDLTAIRELIRESREIIISRIDNSTVKIQSELGTIAISLKAINATLLEKLLPEISSAINTLLSGVESGIRVEVSEVRSLVETVSKTVSDIKSDTETIKESTAAMPTVSTAVWLAVVFSLIAAILSALVTIGVRVRLAS